MMTNELQKKENRAIKLIQSAGKIAEEHGQPLEVCYSGGKDSDVILHLVKKSGIKFRALYKNTTIDPPGTIKHAKEVGAEVIQPKMNFRQVIELKGSPSRWLRSCCRILKEYKILDYSVVGVRRAESAKRAANYHEPEICRHYKGGGKVRQYLPILEWSNDDIRNYIIEENIQCHPLYYDANGIFHVERRLGCMCCPLQNQKQRIEDFKKHPKMLALYIRGERVFRQTKGKEWKSSFENEYEPITFQLFCNSVSEFHEKFGANIFFPEINCKEFLERYFNVKLD